MTATRPGSDLDVSAVEDLAAILGESPLWSPREQALYWLDQEQRKLLRTVAPFARTEMGGLPFRPSCLALRPDRKLLVGYRKGRGTIEFSSGKAEQLPLDSVERHSQLQ